MGGLPGGNTQQKRQLLKGGGGDVDDDGGEASDVDLVHILKLDRQWHAISVAPDLEV